jgi:hypothetical protein
VSKVATKFSDHVGPYQLGVGRSGGAAILVHVASLVVNKIRNQPDEDLCIFSLDCSNAFNTLRRRHIADGVMDACPELLPFYRWSYEQPTDLMTDYKHKVVKSSTGVRQGDPLGSLLFCLGVSKTINGILRDAVQGVKIVSFVDDMYVVGTQAQCQSAHRFLCTRLGNLGLKFNDTKGSIFCSPQTQVLIGNQNQIPIDNQGIVVLSAPLGSKEYTDAKLAQLELDQTQILNCLSWFEDAGESFAILKSCISTRPVYTVRGLQPDRTSAYAESFDRKVGQALAAIAGIVGGLSANAIEIKNLPADMGGLGMKDISNISQEAWTAAWLHSMKYVQTHFPEFLQLMDTNQYDPGVVDRVLSIPAPHVPANRHFNEVVLPLITSDKKLPTQRELSKAQDKPRHEALLDRLRSTEDTKHLAAWVLSSSTKGISSWLYSACTTDMQVRVGHEAFKEGLRLRCLVPPHQDPVPLQVPRACQSCRNDNVPPLHALGCKAASGARIKRHDNIRDCLMDFINKVEPDAILTREYFLNDGRRNLHQERLRADIKCELAGVTTFFDIAVTNPSNPSAIQGANGASNVAGVAAKAMETDKKSLYSSRYSEAVANCVVPFVLEATGRLGDMASRFIDSWCKIGHPNVTEEFKLRAQSARLRLLGVIGRHLVTGNSNILKSSRARLNELSQA